MQVPAFHGNVSFNAHHSPMGAFFTFTCGNFGTRGGLGLEAPRPGNQDIYIGVKDGDRYSAHPMKCLPFYEGADKNAQPILPDMAPENFVPEMSTEAPKKKRSEVLAYTAAQLQRYYAWATDRWVTPEYEFAIYTPFDSIPDPQSATSNQMRAALIPAVTAELVVDNRKGTQTKTGFFALRFSDPGVRLIDSGLSKGRVGFAFRDDMGVAAELVEVKTDGTRLGSDETGVYPFTFMRWAPNEGLADADNPSHMLGSCPGIGFEVPAGKMYVLRLAFGCFVNRIVTTRIEGRYFYTRYFASLTDVLNEALAYIRFAKVDCNTLNDKLLISNLNPDQQFLLAHATRSYYGATQLLDVAGQPYWVVNEGEYCMLNTLDLSVDHVFWENRFNPWLLKNLLENFVRYYSYHDQVKDPKTGELKPGGISFCHDQGIFNNFSPLGRSSYELTNLKGCFSHMTQEQLCNWSIIAASYMAYNNDTEWLLQNKHIIEACAQSMLNRSIGPDGKPTGIMTLDSSRCGNGWEITTYDSLDESLGQARNNLYLAVKCWATYLGLYRLFKQAGNNTGAEQMLQAARLNANNIAAAMRPEGFLPAVFEKDNHGYHSRILPAIEALSYAIYWSAAPNKVDGSDWLALAEFKPLVEALKKHTVTLLSDKEKRNHFADGGLKLSSTSKNTWASKVAIFEHVARELYNLDENGATRTAAAATGVGGWEKSDAAHTKWQVEGKSAYWACSDQIIEGVAMGSKYYPRIVTTMLWFKGL